MEIRLSEVIGGPDKSIDFARRAKGEAIVSSYGAQFTLPTSGLNDPWSVAVDRNGDVFIADYRNSRVVELQAQSVNFGSINICTSGQSTPAPCNETLSLSYTVPDTDTYSFAVLDQNGNPNQEFSVSSTTCTTLNAGSTCTANLTFTPAAPGIRSGSIELIDSNGVQTSTLVYGLGQAPVIAYSPGVQAAISASGVSSPTGITMDEAGNVYIVDGNNSRVLEVTPSGVQSTVASGLSNPWGVAVDGEGNIFISSTYNNNVLAIYASGGQAPISTTGLSQPEGLAVDGAGDLFIADNFNSRVVEITPAGVQTVVPATGLGNPTGVAVDMVGNVYIADSTHGQVVEVTPAHVQTTVPATGLTAPLDVKVDNAGNVYIADINIQGVVQVSPTGVQTILPLSGVAEQWKPQALALDAAGDVVIGDGNGNGVAELLRSQPPTLTFATSPVGQTSSDSPQSFTIQNVGNQPLIASGLSIGANFERVSGSGTPEDCTSSFSLTPGASCNLSISFTPTAVGAISSSAVLTDNALNLNPATQTISLNGTGTQDSQTITFNLPASITYSPNETVTLSATGGNSGNPVTFAVTSGPATVNGNTLTITRAGTVTVTASQAGNTNYAAAVPVSQTITVNAASQTITFNPISSQAQGASLTLSATASSGLAVSFTSLTPSVCAVSGTTAILANAGTCTIQASQAGNANYLATSVSQSFTVLPSFTITPIPGNETIKRGVLAGFILQLNAGNGFSGNVTLSCSGGPTGEECIDLPMTVKLKSNGMAYAVSGILFPANTTPGTYIMTFTGVSGSITQSTTATFTVTK
jgi:sugar lactone lactonase YvrE